MPDNRLRGLSFHVVGGNHLIEAMMKQSEAKPRGIEAADLIIFQGGTDVDPAWYKHKRHSATQDSDLQRDKMEIAVFQSISKNQWCIGICRGAQLLNVLNGGALFQEVPGHKAPHELVYTDAKGKSRKILVSSTHHQMMLVHSSAQKWGLANETQWRELGAAVTDKTPEGVIRYRMMDHHWTDQEIVYYPSSLSLCFQPHPEYAHPVSTRNLFLDCVQRAVET